MHENPLSARDGPLKACKAVDARPSAVRRRGRFRGIADVKLVKRGPVGVVPKQLKFGTGARGTPSEGAWGAADRVAGRVKQLHECFEFVRRTSIETP